MDKSPGTPGSRRSTRSSAPSTPKTPVSVRSDSASKKTPKRKPEEAMDVDDPKTPVQPVKNGGGDSNSKDSWLNRTPKTPRPDPNAKGNKGMGTPKTPVSLGRSIPKSIRSNASSRSGRQDRIVDVSFGSGIGPLSPSGSAVSSLGLGTLSPGSDARLRTPARSGVAGASSSFGTDLDLRSPLNYGTPSSVASRRQGRAPNTPILPRADINSERRLRQINLGGNEGDEPQLVIWGTNVSATEFKQKFKNFMKTFTGAIEDNPDMEITEAGQPYYIQKIHEIHMLDEPFLNLDCSHLKKVDEEMYKQVICYPQEVIPTMDMAVNELFFETFQNAALVHQIQVRPYNSDKTKTMRYLNPEDIDQLVTIHGMVIRTSNIMPEMKEGFFKCSVCSYGASAEIDRGKIIEPILCPNCNTNYSFTLIHNRSAFVDKQMVRLQEDLEDTPVGETPYMAAVFAHGDLVNSVQPGDRVSVTGIYRAAPLRINPRQRSIRAVYKTHIDVVHFKKVDTKRLREDDEGKGLHLSAERIAFIQELSRKEDIYERLAKAIAPSIYEHEDVKKGILLQLFGGTKKDFSSTGRARPRSEINIILCGDPGTSKSQLLKYVFDLVPRSQYTSGKGSSAVGLTAYITKDPETRQIVLQTGALVLADNGVCCIDEFDKMNESTRSVLHEVMEQQTLSIAKAGIICQLNARTSVLAAANPVESQWRPKKTIVENVNLPHTLLSRFDLIFLILDPQTDTYDRRLARHMISLYFRTPEEDDVDLLDMSILRDYIAYAKECINPRLSDEASQRLISAYVDMRKVGSGRGVITAYPRQLESLIRLAEAHAKIRLSQIVEVVDVEEAYRLHREAVKQSATDPLSGKIDISILTTGQSSAARRRKADLVNALKKYIATKGKKGGTLNLLKIHSDMRDNSAWMVTKEMFEDAIKELQDEGILVISGKISVRIC